MSIKQFGRNWSETKKEFDVDDNGNLIPKKITHESNSYKPKELVDLTFKILAVGAIIIPLILFSRQQKASINREKRLFELETYTNTTTAIQIMTNWGITSPEFMAAKNEFYFKLYPKMKFINDPTVLKQVDVVKSYIDYYLNYYKTVRSLDSLSFYQQNFMGASLTGTALLRYKIKKNNLTLDYFTNSIQLNKLAMNAHANVDLFYEVSSSAATIDKIKDSVAYSGKYCECNFTQLYDRIDTIKNLISFQNIKLDSIMITKIETYQ